jgi:D-arabinitol dehydrogenase (NADP+)
MCLLDRKRVKVEDIVNKTFKLDEWQVCLDALKNKTVIKAAIVSD